MKTRFEYRTSKVSVFICDTQEQAARWAAERPQTYIASLKLVKVTTIIREETV